jgi:hypothetical protein
MPRRIFKSNITFEITACPVHVQEDRILLALDYYAALLMPRITRPIAVTVTFIYPSKKDYGATVSPSENRSFKPSTFLIEQNGRTRGWKVYLYLAHEMVHVRQWACGHMQDYDSTQQTRWKDRIIDGWHTDYNKPEYWDMPWEFEAMGLEYALYNKFLIHYKIKQKDLGALK